MLWGRSCEKIPPGEAEGCDFNMMVKRVAHLRGLKREEVLSAGKYKKVVDARETQRSKSKDP